MGFILLNQFVSTIDGIEAGDLSEVVAAGGAIDADLALGNECARS